MQLKPRSREKMQWVKSIFEKIMREGKVSEVIWVEYIVRKKSNYGRYIHNVKYIYIFYILPYY